jgi:hypothetical protein
MTVDKTRESKYVGEAFVDDSGLGTNQESAHTAHTTKNWSKIYGHLLKSGNTSYIVQAGH